MRIQLTQQDVDQGVRGSFYHCPWALALRRLRPGRELLVSNDSIKDGAGDTLYLLPRHIVAWIELYDSFGQGDGWESLSFELPSRLGAPHP